MNNKTEIQHRYDAYMHRQEIISELIKHLLCEYEQLTTLLEESNDLSSLRTVDKQE